MFGKKGLKNTQPVNPFDGYKWVDQHLAMYGQPGSLEFAQSLGERLFDSSYDALKTDRGMRIEDLVAMLSSVAGQLCLFAVLHALDEEGRRPADIGMMSVQGNDGKMYHFGDAPNRLLCEANLAFVSLVFGAAHEHGGKVSLEMLHEEMKKVAERVGRADFLTLDLPSEHSVDSPLEWTRHFTEFVIRTTGKHFQDSVAGFPLGVPSTAEAPKFLMPRIVGFAVQKAIDVGHASIDDVTVLARIAMVCSLRTAKLDPRSFFGKG